MAGVDLQDVVWRRRGGRLVVSDVGLQLTEQCGGPRGVVVVEVVVHR